MLRSFATSVHLSRSCYRKLCMSLLANKKGTFQKNVNKENFAPDKIQTLLLIK